MFLAAAQTASAEGGDDLDSAQQEMNQAFTQFYKSMRDSPDHSPSFAEKLSRQYLSAPRMRLKEVMQSNLLQTLHEAGVRTDDREPPQGKGVPVEKFLSAMENPGGPGDRERDGGDEVDEDSQPSRAKPEVALDGSHIPKELEFPGKKAPVAQKPAARKPASLNPAAPGRR